MEKQTLHLAVNAEKSHLCIIAQEGGSSDYENDRLSSNFLAIYLKVLDITRLEVGREKASKKTSNANVRQVMTFTIVTKKPVGDSTTFNFEADSTGERDQIIVGIKNVLELTKAPSSENRRRRSSKSPIFPEEMTYKSNTTDNSMSSYSEISTRRSTKTSDDSSSDKVDDIAGNASIYFDFNLPMDGPDAAIEAEMRNDDNIRESDGERDAPPDSDNEDNLEEPITALTTKKWSLDNILCGIALASDPSMEISTPRNEDDVLREGKNEALLSPIDGCESSKALALVEDVTLSKMGFNEVSAGPFCTDDVCTATFQDLTDTMKGAFDGNGETEPMRQRTAARNDFVSGVLGAPTAVAANLLSVTDIFAPGLEASLMPKRTVIRNRSYNRRAQAIRLKRLRRQMTFSASIDQMPYVQVVNSYDDIERADRFARRLTSAEISKVHHAESSQFLQTVVETMERDSEASVGEEVLYYDSDPEDTREMALQRGPRRAIAELENSIEMTTPPREALCEIPMSKINMGRKLKRIDDETISEIIERMKNEKMTLLWHPPTTRSAANKAPFCSKVWIESGIYLIDGTFLLPKLTWVPVFEDSIQSKILNVTTRNPGTIDLLDVCRVRDCKHIDRSLYPFASADCSFMIQTQTETQLFEARSRDERIRVVNALRLVIARLASLLMLRDLRAVDEFFGGNSVPGEAPTWAQGKTERADPQL